VTRGLDAETRSGALVLGADAVLAKPLDPRDLLAALVGHERPPGRPGETPPRPVGAGRPVAPPVAPAARVLVVDDDPYVRAMLEEFLAGEGYHVRGTADAQAALREIRQSAPDVVLLDIAMPGLSGVDALDAIRVVAPGTAVIMVSGIVDLETAKRTLARGAFDYVPKPVDLAYLVQSVAVALLMKQIARP
jgi:two-component system, OmpR family, response regulator MprA